MAASLLQSSGINSRLVGSFQEMVDALGDDILFTVVVEEALRSNDLKPIYDWVISQPSWSDLPFIVLTQRGAGPEQNPAAARMAEVLGNLSFIERPFHPTTFISVARSAHRNRRRQYEARSRMEELWEGEQRLKTALLAGHLGTWEIEFDGWQLTASDACKGIFGRSADDAFSYDDLFGSIHPNDLERLRHGVARTVVTGNDYLTEFRTIWPDGSEHWADICGRVVRNRQGRPIRLVGVASDITGRKSSEVALLSMNEMLEQRVDERTTALREANERLLAESTQREKAEEKLRQSQKLEAIGQLTGGIAHDFNNLLMAVLGNLELLRKHLDDDPKAARLIDGALQGAQRGASLTQRLLAFARRQDLRIEPTDFAALVESMRELLTRSVGSSIEVRTEIPTGLSLALADSNQVELALLNLVVNARDAMPDGGTVTIRLRQELDVRPSDDVPRGAYICLSVTDTGHGMDAETMKRAIDPFFSTKELGKGTGLGLSMIHGLALQLSGALTLSSTIGEGTTAELWLPATDVDLQPQTLPQGPLSAQESSRTARILVVDDDALIAMSAVDMLEDLGHQVLEASSGDEALKLIAGEDGIDLVITDYSMPGMNGAQLAKAAREVCPDLPILVATGYADLPPGAGIDLPRLSKPYTQHQLQKEIAKILG